MIISEFKIKNQKCIGSFFDNKNVCYYPILYQKYNTSDIPNIANFYYKKMIKLLSWYFWKIKQPLESKIPKDIKKNTDEEEIFLPTLFIKPYNYYFPIICRLYHPNPIDFSNTIRRREISQYLFIGKLSQDILNMDLMFFIYFNYKYWKVRVLINGKEVIIEKQIFKWDNDTKSTELVKIWKNDIHHWDHRDGRIIFTKEERKYQNNIYNQETNNIWKDDLININ